MRNILILLGGMYVLTGLYILFAPHDFYNRVPGVAMMGPFNIHFIRDAALAYMASGAAIIWGTHKGQSAVIISGASWQVLHGLFHIQIWGVRGFPFDIVTATDFFGVVTPAAMVLWLCFRLKTLPKKS